MIFKADSVSTLGYHWTDHTGRPLESQVHWNATGTTLADASTQWCLSGDPVLICIIGTHWNTTGNTLEMHWLPTVLPAVAFQCTLGSKYQAHWIATGLPMNYHWLRVRGVYHNSLIREPAKEFHGHILSIPLEAGRGLSTGICGLDDTFPPNDPASDPYTLSIIYISYILAAI